MDSNETPTLDIDWEMWSPQPQHPAEIPINSISICDLGNDILWELVAILETSETWIKRHELRSYQAFAQTCKLLYGITAYYISRKYEFLCDDRSIDKFCSEMFNKVNMRMCHRIIRNGLFTIADVFYGNLYQLRPYKTKDAQEISEKVYNNLELVGYPKKDSKESKNKRKILCAELDDMIHGRRIDLKR